MKKELDLSESRWVLSRDINLEIISQLLFDNFPMIDINEELNFSGYSMDDLLDESKLKDFLIILNKKYKQ